MTAAKKSVLGRGLGALIDDSGMREVNNDQIREINIDDIDVNPFQPRTNFDEEALIELAASIKELGIIQPVTVRDLGNGKYQIISGERRTRASKLAGLKTIPAYVRQANDQGMLEMSLVENIQREELDPIEISLSYQRLMDECQLTQELLSERVGKKRSTIANYLRLLKLPVEIQKGIRNRKVSTGHAKALSSLSDPDQQIKICLDIVEKQWSVRQTEEYIRKLLKPARSKSKIAKLPEEYNQLEQHLSDHFQTKVEFTRNKNGNGKIVIPFKTDNELEKIIAILDRLNS